MAGPLRRNPVFRRFWLARTVSLVGDGAATIALVLVASAQPHPGRAVALILLAESLPRLFGPFAGALADRTDVRRLLIAMELAQGLLFALIAGFHPGTAVLVPMVAIAAACSTIYGAAGRTVTPRLVERDDLMAANAWLGTAFNLQVVLGPLAGGLLVAYAHAAGAFAVDAASFAAGAALLATLPALPAAPRDGSAPGFLADVAAGLRYARGHRVARTIILLLLFGVLFGSLDNVVLVFFARSHLHAGAAGFGLLSTGFGVAMIAASLWLSRAAGRLSSAAVLTGGWFLTGLGLVLTAISPVLGLAVAMQAVAGGGNGLANIGEETLLQQSVPADRLGRVGGVMTAAAFLGSSASYGLGGLLVGRVAPAALLAVAGAGLMAAAVPSWFALRNQGSTAQGEPGEPVEQVLEGA